MSLTTTVLIVALLILIGMFVWFLKEMSDSRDSIWLYLAVIAVVLIMATALSIYFVEGRSDSSEEHPQVVVTETVTTTSTTRTTTRLQPSDPDQLVETTTEEPVTITTTADPPPYTPPVEEVEQPVRMEYVSHVFVANRFGVRSGAQYPFYLVEEYDWESEGKMLSDIGGGYFVASWETMENSQNDILEFRFVDDYNNHTNFAFPFGKAEFVVDNILHPHMAVVLEDSEDLETGVYGVTRYWPETPERQAESEQCELSEMDDSLLTCTWQHHELVAETEIRKDLFERGLSHVLTHGIAKVEVIMTEAMYDQFSQ